MVKEEKMQENIISAGLAKKLEVPKKNKTEKCSNNKELFQQELLALLEDAIEPTYTWVDDGGNIINMRIAMQELMEDDPWMHEELTDEEKKVFNKLDGDNFRTW
jgi:hypothetical protein